VLLAATPEVPTLSKVSGTSTIAAIALAARPKDIATAIADLVMLANDMSSPFFSAGLSRRLQGLST
jgi:hypothetical protein